MVNLVDSLERARREHKLALGRGDTEAATLIQKAIEVLERGIEGELVPRQRQPEPAEG